MGLLDDSEKRRGREGQETGCTSQYMCASVFIRLTMMYLLMSTDNADCMYPRKSVALLLQN